MTRNILKRNHSLPTVSLVDVISVSRMLETRALDLVVPRELQSVLLGYPVHEAGGVGNHRRVLT